MKHIYVKRNLLSEPYSLESKLWYERLNLPKLEPEDRVRLLLGTSRICGTYQLIFIYGTPHNVVEILGQ